MVNDKLMHHEDVFIFASTPMCGTCQLAEKMLTVIAEARPETLIGKLNMNYHPDIAQAWEIESVPCLLHIKNQRVEKRMYAFQSVPHILDFMTYPSKPTS
ncbi:thioredoxin family protein [Bacillaceae bacterium SIJ1]|uniref:thioredoxin family protein n=1 Tax=Litoribacterium kuwaitense TaxID=1398745 RepID=UPI0013EA13DF|nr:thioredoxin family protein [Litoribacterium kuwaitense]NGP46339.1 thioredoxin family protein [Litoribacterium kuwaitense]